MKKLLFLLMLISCGPNEKVVERTGTDAFPAPTVPIPPPRVPPQPGFQNLDKIEDTILLDLQNLSSDRARRDARYFLGCDRSNLNENINLFEQGMDRGINQLSLERQLHKLTAIGEAQCIFRVDLSEIGWTASDWRVIELNDILFFISDTIRNQNIQFLTQTRRPYVYGSSAMVTAYEGDAVANKAGTVYYRLTRQAQNTANFFRDQGIDRQVEVNDERALFSGFSQSQIALGKTRMIAIFESRDGIVISTYDTKFGGDDLFSNPFSLELSRASAQNGRVNTSKVFKHDAQEHVASLPNGLWGLYRLNNAADNAEVAAPTDIVINVNGAQIDPTIRIGDCSNCHYKEGAAIPFRDQLRAHIIGNGAFDQVEKNLARIFFQPDQISAKLDQLNRSHAQALTALGVTHTEDPLWNVVVKPIRQEMSVEQVASLFFIETPDFIERLRGTAVSSQVLGNLVTGGTISLATLSQNFGTLVAEIGAFRDENL